MEPRWLLSDIRVIFTDGFITNQLLIDLGITEKGTLRGDYDHLVREVWKNQFVLVVFSIH